MRISGGTARGRVIRPPKGVELRPSEERVRQALFNILAPVVEGARFLDLFCGSGAVGLEALSRGAGSAVFADSDPRCLDCAREHALAFGFPESALAFHRLKLPAGLERLGGPFDLVFLDPPYESGAGADTLRALGGLAILKPGGLSRLVYEHDRRSGAPDSVGGLSKLRQYDYGGTSLSFYSAGDAN